MPTRIRPRTSIGQVMILVAVLAVLLAIGTIPPESRALLISGAWLAAVVAVVVVIVLWLIEVAVGVGCPSCGHRGMGRPAVASFGSRFFLCPACGARPKRGLLRIWSDASGPEYDDVYRKRTNEDPWSSPPGLEDDDVAYSKTHLNLVRNKRRRRPDDPNGPGLE